jgi:predicted MPP superfamily phosphohydrolase
VLAVFVPLFFLGLFVASIWYVAYRLRTLFAATRRWPLRSGTGIWVFGSMTAMLSAAKSTSSAVGLLSTLGGYVFSFYVFLLLLLLITHAVQMKRNVPRRWVSGSALALALVITVAGALWANPFGVAKTEVALDGLKQDVVVMHISDVHIGHQRGRAYLAEIVEVTNHHQPDVVLINGDLVDANAALQPGVLSPLEDFEAPVFFVGGNHDNYVDNARLLELLGKHGVRVLHNEIVEVKGIYLVGLDYMNPDENTFDMHPSEDTRTIKSVLPGLELADDKPSVLMHHSPVGAQYAAAKGIDLMVSGHTHAGQMFPGTLFAPFIFPYSEGLHQEGKMQVFVSQGAGTFGPRMRLGTSNEINLIRLRAKK